MTTPPFCIYPNFVDFDKARDYEIEMLPMPPPPKPKQAASTRAIFTLVLGILSVLCLGFLSGIPAIILGSFELSAIRKAAAPASGEGMTRIGIILGIIGSAFTFFIFFAILALLFLGSSLMGT